MNEQIIVRNSGCIEKKIELQQFVDAPNHSPHETWKIGQERRHDVDIEVRIIFRHRSLIFV
ncbi:hypothetical protein WK11_05460 [Burkholderia ubonensis]|nr:hypothetical protein WK11_05460 [Burkholderia ubonensis]RQZ81301.1 hypothetical protein DF058_34410 [Burkholderia cenocepacia]RRA03225.1 hypothetical protein DF059_34565 [Burkholderia cenocepacia]